MIGTLYHTSCKGTRGEVYDTIVENSSKPYVNNTFGAHDARRTSHAPKSRHHEGQRHAYPTVKRHF